MANTTQKLIDTERRVVYKFTGNATETPVLKIDAGGLDYALNTTNQLLSGGGARKNLYRLALKKIIYDVAPGQGAGNGYVEIYWTGAPNTTMVTLSGVGKMDFAEGGDGIVILNNATGSTANGNVGLQTVNFAATGCSYTIIADFRKHAEDYNTQPAAF
jgi:hypothetical protein